MKWKLPGNHWETTQGAAPPHYTEEWALHQEITMTEKDNNTLDKALSVSVSMLRKEG